jgi:hypothetical protein
MKHVKSILGWAIGNLWFVITVAAGVTAWVIFRDDLGWAVSLAVAGFVGGAWFMWKNHKHFGLQKKG